MFQFFGKQLLTLLLRLAVRDIDKGHDDAIDRALNGAVGVHAHDEAVGSVSEDKIAFDNRPIMLHGLQVGLQRVVVKLMDDISDRAANVAFAHWKERRHAWCEMPD